MWWNVSIESRRHKHCYECCCYSRCQAMQCYSRTQYIRAACVWLTVLSREHFPGLLLGPFVPLIYQGIQATLTDLDLGASLWGPEELPVACPLTSFRLATRDDILKLVSKAPTKSCELDTMPTWLLKQCSDGIIPSMTSIINMKLESGVVPPVSRRHLSDRC